MKGEVLHHANWLEALEANKNSAFYLATDGTASFKWHGGNDRKGFILVDITTNGLMRQVVEALNEKNRARIVERPFIIAHHFCMEVIK